jgi:hypothetical protein
LSAGSPATARTHHLSDSIHPTPHIPHAARTTGQTDTEPARPGFRFRTANHTRPAFAPQPALNFSISASHNLKPPFHRLLHIQSMLPAYDIGRQMPHPHSFFPVLATHTPFHPSTTSQAHSPPGDSHPEPLPGTVPALSDQCPRPHSFFPAPASYIPSTTLHACTPPAIPAQDHYRAQGAHHWRWQVNGSHPHSLFPALASTSTTASPPPPTSHLPHPPLLVSISDQYRARVLGIMLWGSKPLCSHLFSRSQHPSLYISYSIHIPHSLLPISSLDSGLYTLLQNKCIIFSQIRKETCTPFPN